MWIKSKYVGGGANGTAVATTTAGTGTGIEGDGQGSGDVASGDVASGDMASGGYAGWVDSAPFEANGTSTGGVDLSAIADYEEVRHS